MGKFRTMARKDAHLRMKDLRVEASQQALYVSLYVCIYARMCKSPSALCR